MRPARNSAAARARKRSTRGTSSAGAAGAAAAPDAASARAGGAASARAAGFAGSDSGAAFLGSSMGTSSSLLGSTGVLIPRAGASFVPPAASGHVAYSAALLADRARRPEYLPRDRLALLDAVDRVREGRRVAVAERQRAVADRRR